MEVNYIALAIPLFLVLIGMEVIAAKAAGRRVLRLHDAVVDMSCGISQQVALVFMKGALLAGYVLVYENLRVFSFAAGSPAPWLVAFVGVDFLYYWWHRFSHEVNLLWAVHVVHHQSEDYNLAVALRQAAFSGVTSWPFFAPLAVLGVPPLIFATISAFSTLYQFWIHTRLIGRLGPAEAVLNTPSHHRVHHAINPRYLDRNYGATFIVWDRLFGTFEEESEPPVYGIVKPLRSFQPMWAQVHYWVDLWWLSRRASGPREKLKVWFASPAWAPAGVDRPPPPEVSPDTFERYDPPLHRAVGAYVGIQFLAAVGATFGLMVYDEALALPARVLLAAVILLAVLAFGALFEGRRWAFALEYARLAIVAGAALLLDSLAGVPAPAWLTTVLVASSVAFALMLALVQRALRAPPDRTTAAAA